MIHEAILVLRCPKPGFAEMTQLVASQCKQDARLLIWIGPALNKPIVAGI